MLLRMKDEDKDEKDEAITGIELARLEEEASRKIFQSLLLPQRIGEALNAAAVSFVVCGVVLNVFGYGYVVQDNHMITIDTLENREFQIEVRKSMNERANKIRNQ